MENSKKRAGEALEKQRGTATAVLVPLDDNLRAIVAEIEN
jgi:hypothetical protein